MAACGHISAHLLHWMQRAASHTGISRASARFSQRVVPSGHVPSTGKALTGSRSPWPASSAAVTRCTNSGASRGTTGGRARVASARAGRATSCSAASVASTAAQLRSTTVAPFARVGLGDGRLDARDGRLGRQHAREREERGLHDRVDAATEAELAGEAVRVDHEQPQPLLQYRLLHLAGQMVPDGLWGVGRIQQHGRPGGGDAEYVEALEEAELVARDEMACRIEVGRADGSRTEAQVRHGDRAGLLRVVDEVALPEAVGVLGQDLDRVLVRPHRAVGAEPVEHGADLVGGLDVEVVRDGQRGPRDVVDDADGEMAAGADARARRRTACTMAGVNSFEASP